MQQRRGPRILLIGGTYRALCVLERLLDRGSRVVAFLGVEGTGERDFCPEILEICDRASIPARSGHKLGEEIVRWLEDRVRPELAISVGVDGQVPVAIGGNCRLGLLEITDMMLSEGCPGLTLRQRGQTILTKDLGGRRRGEESSDTYLRMIDALLDALDEFLDRVTPRENQLPPALTFEREDWETWEVQSDAGPAGPQTAALEADVRAYVGAEHAFALRSSSDAFRLLGAALGLEDGAEVVCGGLASAEALTGLRRNGARTPLVDVEADRLTPDPERIAETLLPGTRALLISHTLGQPADLAALYALAESRGLDVIEDGLDALGARIEDSRLGRSPCTCVFRLPLGPAGSGREVAFVTAPSSVAERLEPQVKELRLEDARAAIARRELAALDQRIAVRRANASAWSSALVPYDAFRVPPTPEGALSTYAGYAVRMTRFARTTADDLAKLLTEAGIETRPLPIGLRERDLVGLPVTESARATTLMLPVERPLDDSDRERVLDAIFSYAIG